MSRLRHKASSERIGGIGVRGSGRRGTPEDGTAWRWLRQLLLQLRLLLQQRLCVRLRLLQLLRLLESAHRCCRRRHRLHSRGRLSGRTHGMACLPGRRRVSP